MDQINFNKSWAGSLNLFRITNICVHEGYFVHKTVAHKIWITIIFVVKNSKYYCLYDQFLYSASVYENSHVYMNTHV